MSSDKQINIKIILEIAGRPPEHLTETLNELIGKMDDEKGISVEDKVVHDPVLMKDQKDFYTSFAEIELKIEGIEHLSLIILKYMPAHIEIIEPELIAITNADLNNVFNDFARRFHHYDEVARVLQSEKMILENRLKGLLEKKPKD